MRASHDALRQLNWRRTLWMTALVFLFNPYFHGLDILPDFIGYLLLVSGLRRVALLDGSFEEAVRLFRRLALLSAVRLVALGWIIAVPSADEQPTLLLLLCFVMGVLELMTALPACHQLFHGLTYLGFRMGGTAVLSSVRDNEICRLQQKLARLNEDTPAATARRATLERRMARARSGRSITDGVCLGCQAFAVVKTVLCVLPELTALTDASYRAGATLFNWYAYVNGFRVIMVAVGLVIGIVWLVRMIRYCLYIEKDTVLWQTLAARCDEDDAAHPERLPAGRLRRAVLIMQIALVFCTNLTFDGVNVLPGFVSSLLLLAALIPLHFYLPKCVTLVSGVVFGFHAVVSAVAYGMTIRFFANYDLYAYFRKITVQRAYDRICTVVVVEAVVMAAVFGVLSWIAVTLIRRYTSGYGAATYVCSKEEMIRRRQRALCRHMSPVLIFGLLSTAMHVVYALLLVEYEFIWIPDVALSLLLLLFGRLRLCDLTEELDPCKMVAVDRKRNV